VLTEYDIPHGLWQIEADRWQIGQVVQNLVLNAIKTMPDGGKLKIPAENLYLNNSSPPKLRDGYYVQINIDDQGVGIPPENMKHLFDPFFTTKKQGTGLGLAISNSFVIRHGDHLFAISGIGKGSILSLILPAVVESLGKKPLFDFSYKTYNGLVLVVDDEPDVIKVASGMLKKMGMKAVSASGSKRAISTLKK
jgi:signal transduction histidine kinase